MAKRSQQWKALEREAAKALRGERVTRGDDFSVSDVDVVVPDIPVLKVDCKYRKSHAHHSLLAEIKKKYCGEDDIPVLITKHHNQRGACVTLELKEFAFLLNLSRAVAAMPNAELIIRTADALGEPDEDEAKEVA